MNVQEGDRVRLAAFEEEPEQVGTVLEVYDDWSGLAVQLDEPPGGFEDEDDGVRELNVDQVLEVLP